jgi:hypothetical protein
VTLSVSCVDDEQYDLYRDDVTKIKTHGLFPEWDLCVPVFSETIQHGHYASGHGIGQGQARAVEDLSTRS